MEGALMKIVACCEPPKSRPVPVAVPIAIDATASPWYERRRQSPVSRMGRFVEAAAPSERPTARGALDERSREPVIGS